MQPLSGQSWLLYAGYTYSLLLQKQPVAWAKGLSNLVSSILGLMDPNGQLRCVPAHAVTRAWFSLSSSSDISTAKWNARSGLMALIGISLRKRICWDMRSFDLREEGQSLALQWVWKGSTWPCAPSCGMSVSQLSFSRNISWLARETGQQILLNKSVMKSTHTLQAWTVERELSALRCPDQAVALKNWTGRRNRRAGNKCNGENGQMQWCTIVGTVSCV